MKKLLSLVIILFLIGSNSYSQINFSDFPIPESTELMPEFIGVRSSSVEFSDVDGDNDQDVLITGSNDSGRVSRLYMNNGLGLFTEVLGTPFENVDSGSLAFSDIDGDGDNDVLITGLNEFNQPSSKLYTNNGDGEFIEVTGTPFDGVKYSSIAFADVDEDGDQDVLITGKSNSELIAKLYINDGTGFFSEFTNTPFPGVEFSSIAFSDIDNDGDQDVLITGRDSQSVKISKIFKNDGMGYFTEVLGTPFEGVNIGSSLFSDVDGDGDQDILITGDRGSFDYISKLYENDGNGNYSEVIGTPFAGVKTSSIAFIDSDEDGDQDLIITGYSSFGYITKHYVNDGSGAFIEVENPTFKGTNNGSVAFADIDGDNDQDVLLTGIAYPGGMCKLYINDGFGVFAEITDMPLQGVSWGSLAFSDIDNDGDEDVLITGDGYYSKGISKLYKNNGSGVFTEVSGSPFEHVSYSSIAFDDVDNDGDEDVLITGRKNINERVSKLYENDGQGNFTEVQGTPFEGVSTSSIAFADIDNDGDNDVLITGYAEPERISKLYTNNGSGEFTELANTTISGITNSAVAFADIDGDNDLDLLIKGYSDAGAITKLYSNDGTGSFNEVSDTPFESFTSYAFAFCDVDGDNDEDLFINGIIGTPPFGQRFSKLFTNDGAGQFIEMEDTPFETSLAATSIGFSDIDCDGDKDLLILGSRILGPFSFEFSKLYINDGSGVFEELSESPFPSVDNGFIVFSDVDGDKDEDVLIIGDNDSDGRITRGYINENCLPKTVEGKVNAYPNPFINELNLSLGGSDFSFQITDVLGKHILSNTSTNSNFILSTTNWQSGVYFVKMFTSNGIKTTRVVKQ